MTSAQRDDNRFTDADRATIIARLAEVTAAWPRTHNATVGADGETLTRVGAHAIGCGLHDLRQSEEDEVRTFAAAAIGSHNAHRMPR